MFYVFYRYNKNKNNYDELKKGKDKELEDNKECILCLENNNEIFYNYKYKNNKYIHNCECTPDIHYKCFLENYYKKNESCIICLETIEKKKDCDYVILFRVSKIRVMVIWIFFLLFIYSLYENIDIFIFDNLKREDLLSGEYTY